MSKLTDQLREHRVSNSYEFYGETPYIDCFVTGYRDVWPSSWCVIARGQDLNNGRAHYREQDSVGGTRRSFTYVGRDGKKKAFADACAWASERFGIEEWKRDPFGSFGPADYVDARIKEILG